MAGFDGTDHKYEIYQGESIGLVIPNVKISHDGSNGMKIYKI